MKRWFYDGYGLTPLGAVVLIIAAAITFSALLVLTTIGIG